MSRWLLALTAGIWISGTAAGAHHSLSDYDSSRQVTIEGIVAQYQFVNPHPGRDGGKRRVPDHLTGAKPSVTTG